MPRFRRHSRQVDDSRQADRSTQQLTRQQQQILRNRGTERPYSGQYVEHDANGVYHCVNCGAALFDSDSKFESTTPGLIGWPAFSDVFGSDSVDLRPDNSLGMRRTEVVCKQCGGHLGHLFDDPDAPNRTHYCVNSACLHFKEASAKQKKDSQD